MMEAVRIRRQTFARRYPLDDFLQGFRCLGSAANAREGCGAPLHAWSRSGLEGGVARLRGHRRGGRRLRDGRGVRSSDGDPSDDDDDDDAQPEEDGGAHSSNPGNSGRLSPASARGSGSQTQATRCCTRSRELASPESSQCG